MNSAAQIRTRRREKATATATSALLDRERFRSVVYEPIRTDEGIIQAVHKRGIGLFMTSIGLLDYNVRDINNIITEPLSMGGIGDLVRKAVDLVTDKAAFLMPLNFLAEQRPLIEDLPLARIWVLTKRLPYRKGHRAWYVFEKGHRYDPPDLRWI